MPHSNKDYRMPKIGILDPREARADLTSRECAKLIGALVGGLVEMANPEDVRTALRWWCEYDAPWEAFKAYRLCICGHDAQSHTGILARGAEAIWCCTTPGCDCGAFKPAEGFR